MANRNEFYFCICLSVVYSLSFDQMNTYTEYSRFTKQPLRNEAPKETPIKQQQKTTKHIENVKRFQNRTQFYDGTDENLMKYMKVLLLSSPSFRIFTAFFRFPYCASGLISCKHAIVFQIAKCWTK